MIIDDITRDDVMMVLENVQATCALNEDNCISCPYADHNYYNLCTLAHIPGRWQLDQIGGDRNED